MRFGECVSGGSPSGVFGPLGNDGHDPGAMPIRRAWRRSLSIAVHGCVLFWLGILCACGISSDAPLEAWGSSLSAEAWSELLGRREKLQSLSLPPDFVHLGTLPDELQVLDLRGSDIDVVDALPRKLLRLDLRNSKVRRITTLPPDLRWLDVRYSKSLESLPAEILPPGLTHLGVDGRLVSGWLTGSDSKLPKGLRSLALNQPPEDVLENHLPAGLEVLELDGGRVKRFHKLPPSLRRVCLLGTRLESFESLPRSLDHLALASGTLGAEVVLGSERLPPYLTDLYLGEGVRLRVRAGSHGDRQLRYVHKVHTDDAVLIPIPDPSGTARKIKIFPLLAELITDSSPVIGIEQLGGLEHLRVDIQASAESQKLLDLLESLPETTRLELRVSDLRSLRDRPGLQERLNGLTLAEPYQGGSLPSGLDSLDLQLRAAPGPDQWPEGLRHLVIRHRGDRPLDELLTSLPGLLEELEIETTGPNVALSGDLMLPRTLRSLKLTGLEVVPWTRVNPRPTLPALDTLVLKDAVVDTLVWVPPRVKAVHVLDGHPEESEGYDGCL